MHERKAVPLVLIVLHLSYSIACTIAGDRRSIAT